MIIGITGRIASGKESVLNYFKEQGFMMLNISDIIRDVMLDRYIKITRKNMQDFGNLIREYEGSGAWIKRLMETVKPGEDYVINGIRNPGEITELRKRDDFVLIAVDAHQDKRFDRLMKRKKPSDPKTWEDFLKIDERDLGEEDPNGQQVGKCMEFSDYKIVNDSTLEEFRKKIEETWKEIQRRIKDNPFYRGVIIEESLFDKSILNELKIIDTKIEKVIPKHKTPWIKQWTLHTVEIPVEKISDVSEKISNSLDKEHSWYADFKNKQFHYMIFRGKIFCIDRTKKEEYDKAKEYGIRIGIPPDQVDFSPDVEV